MNEAEKAIIILKNDALFVDGEHYDAYVLVGVKDTGRNVAVVQNVSGTFTEQGFLRALKSLHDVAEQLSSIVHS